jgi:tetratricopeptide (TPR) repeat protein
MRGQYDYDLIRDYLHGLVDQHTAREMADLIATDETARSIAQGILFLERNFTSEAEAESYLEQFRQKQLSVVEAQTARRNAPPLWLKIAASVLVLAIIAFVVRFNSSKNALAIADDELSQPYPVPNITRGNTDPSTFEIGLHYYATRKYRQALKYFEQASPNTSDAATLAFYKGLSQLYQGDYTDARESFQNEALSKSRYVEQARWFSALTLIKAGDTQQARKVLDEISKDPSHYRHQVARDLLRSLDD